MYDEALLHDVMRAERMPVLKKYFIQKYGRKYSASLERAAEEIEKIREIKNITPNIEEDIVFCAIGYGFSPYEYFSYNLVNKEFNSRRAFLSDREVMNIVHRYNDSKEIKILNDKFKTYQMFSAYYGREAICVEHEEDRSRFMSFAAGKQAVVKKIVNEAMGRGVELIPIEEGLNLDELFTSLIEIQKKLIIEDLIIQHNDMAAFNPSSVNTIRIITFNTTKGIIAPFCFLKVGRKHSFVDNGGAGGLLVGVDIDTGITNTQARDELGTVYEIHPDSGKRFKDFVIPEFDQAIALALKASNMIPNVKYIGWDLAYTNEGWIIVEGNGKSQLIGPQMTMQRGVRDSVDSILGNINAIS